MRRAPLVFALLLAGCPAEDEEAPRDAAVAADAGVFEGGADAADADAAAPDAEPAPPPCLPPADRTVAIDPDGPDTQIHGAVAFDGQSLWIAYNRPTAEGDFDVYLTRLDCAGETTLEPVLVSDDPVGNDVDPAVAIGPEGVLVAWATDTGEFPNNLSARLRAFDLQGAPRGDERRLALTLDGEPFEGNAWMVQVAPHPDGGFALAGARGIEALSAFNVFVQRVDAEGASVGETWALSPAETSQLEPDLRVTDAGDIEVVWIEGDQGAGALVQARLQAGDDAFQVKVLDAGPVGGARLVSGRAGWVAWSDVQTGEAVVWPEGADPLRFGGAGRHHSPVVAARADDAVVAWYRVVRGLQNAVQLQTLEEDEALELPMAGPAAPYPLALVPVADRIVFVVWSEGESPAFRLKGRFVRR